MGMVKPVAVLVEITDECKYVTGGKPVSRGGQLFIVQVPVQTVKRVEFWVLMAQQHIAAVVSLALFVSAFLDHTVQGGHKQGFPAGR